jgi:hypothetical protein
MLCVRCVVRTAFSLDWMGILDSPDKFKTHRISHARQDLYFTKEYIQYIKFIVNIFEHLLVFLSVRGKCWFSSL